MRCQAGPPGQGQRALSPSRNQSITHTGVFHLPTESHQEELQRPERQRPRSLVSTVLPSFSRAPVHSAPGWAAPPSSFQEVLASNRLLDRSARPAPHAPRHPPRHVRLPILVAGLRGGPGLEGAGGKARVLASEITGRKCLVPRKGTEPVKVTGGVILLPGRGILASHERGTGKEEARA